jgi:hypothetical protein
MFDPTDYALVGDHLRAAAGDGLCPPEAAFRVASGRYYYAALLSARSYLEHSSPMPMDRSERTHQTVIRALRDSSDPTALRLGGELDALRGLRNMADYGDEIARPQAHAERMAEGCRRALRLVETLERRGRR